MRKQYKTFFALAPPEVMMANSYVICNQVGFCKESDYCGGARTHLYQPEECGKCPFDKHADCVPIRSIGDNDE